MGIDLGPSITFLIIILIIIPGAVGFLIGTFLCFLVFKRAKLKKLIKLILCVFLIISSTSLLPFVAVRFNYWQAGNENRKFRVLEREYANKNLQAFHINKVYLEDANHFMDFTVPRDGTYHLKIWVFQEDIRELVVNTWKGGIALKAGLNTVLIPVSDKTFTYSKPLDLSISIQNVDKNYALKNLRKYLGVTNYGSIVMLEGVLYYSPKIITKDPCSAFNYLNRLACKEEAKLHFVSGIK